MERNISRASTCTSWESRRYYDYYFACLYGMWEAGWTKRCIMSDLDLDLSKKSHGSVTFVNWDSSFFVIIDNCGTPTQHVHVSYALLTLRCILLVFGIPPYSFHLTNCSLETFTTPKIREFASLHRFSRVTAHLHCLFPGWNACLWAKNAI